ncbi:citrate synthase-lysine N-methyltransferase CSKMT, mitochondrial-like [Ptychodera flava]|uniref:citrate synthase-lysine N-methyltransferase CSKMT, mitochondrial-like n=1 Tax=Ptychodera flava TaxID=63121 RepID=UPI00396A42BF
MAAPVAVNLGAKARVFSSLNRTLHMSLVYRRMATDRSIVNNMGDRSTWNSFYEDKENKTFDWFIEFDDVYDLVNRYLPKPGSVRPGRTFSILDLGCGTSNFSIQAHQKVQCESRLWCVDFSEVAVSQLAALCTERIKAGAGGRSAPGRETHFAVADVNSLPFKDSFFDLALDKGTLDAVLRAKEGTEVAISGLCEAMRVLSPEGHFLHFSDEHPDVRLDLLEKARNRYTHANRHVRISIGFKSVNENSHSFEYFLYNMSKIDRKE